MNSKDKIYEKLKQIRLEHRDLDEVINHLSEKKTINLMQLKRLKKRKLLLRDRIQELKNLLEPDIIA